MNFKTTLSVSPVNRTISKYIVWKLMTAMGSVMHFNSCNVLEIWVLYYTTKGNKQTADINSLSSTNHPPQDDDGFVISAGRP